MPPTVLGLDIGGANLKAATADDGSATPFSISLQGFAPALDRVIALAR